jgi:hypothetical protein
MSETFRVWIHETGTTNAGHGDGCAYVEIRSNNEGLQKRAAGWHCASDCRHGLAMSDAIPGAHLDFSVSLVPWNAT